MSFIKTDRQREMDSTCGRSPDRAGLSGLSAGVLEAIGPLLLGDKALLSLWQRARGGQEHEEGGAEGLSSWRHEVS